MPQIEINKYIDANWLVKVTNETTTHTVTNQAFDSFRNAVYKTYLPIYEKANQIENPRARARAQVRVRKAMASRVNKFFGDYRNKSLDSLAKATLAAKRIQFDLLDDQAASALLRGRKPTAKATAVEKRAERRQLQLGTGSRADTKKQSYRHKGSSKHVIDKLTAGLHREFKKVGVTQNRGQTINKTKEWVKTVARTEAQGTIADADQQAIRESFEKYRYVAVLDENTTDRCADLDGQVFTADEYGGVKPPQHFNCRSELQPVTVDKQRDKALAKAAQTKFNKWLRARPENIQEKIVGKARFKAFKEGKYDPPPRWRSQRQFYVDPKTDMPVVATKDNIDRLDQAVELVDVKFNPKLLELL